MDSGPGVMRRYRKERKISQDSLARLADVSVSAISQIERGVHGVSRDTAEKIDRALEARGELLVAFGYTDTPSPTPDSDASVYDGLERITNLVTGISSDIRRMEAQLTANREQLALLAQRLDVDVVPVPRRPD